MTFWHLSLSFNAHLAHLPSPVMVTSLPSSAANDGAASGSRSSPAMLVNRTMFFLILPFGLVESLLWLGSSQNIRRIGGKFCSKVVRFRLKRKRLQKWRKGCSSAQAP